MGPFRGAVFHHGGVPENCPLALMGRFPSLMGRFPPLMGRFPECLNGPFSLLKSSGKQPIKKRGIKRFLIEKNKHFWALSVAFFSRRSEFALRSTVRCLVRKGPLGRFETTRFGNSQLKRLRRKLRATAALPKLRNPRTLYYHRQQFFLTVHKLFWDIELWPEVLQSGYGVNLLFYVFFLPPWFCQRVPAFWTQTLG